MTARWCGVGEREMNGVSNKARHHVTILCVQYIQSRVSAHTMAEEALRILPRISIYVQTSPGHTW